MDFADTIALMERDQQEELALLLLEKRDALRRNGFADIAAMADAMLLSVVQEHVLGAVGDLLMDKLDKETKERIFERARPFLEELPTALIRAYDKLGRTMPVRLKPLILEVDEDPVFPVFVEELKKELAA